jgi:hypothetical protein
MYSNVRVYRQAPCGHPKNALVANVVDFSSQSFYDIEQYDHYNANRLGIYAGIMRMQRAMLQYGLRLPQYSPSHPPGSYVCGTKVCPPDLTYVQVPHVSLTLGRGVFGTVPIAQSMQVLDVPGAGKQLGWTIDFHHDWNAGLGGNSYQLDVWSQRRLLGCCCTRW